MLAATRVPIQNHTKCLCIALIWCIVAYDIRCCEYLVDFPKTELNPLCRQIIETCGIWNFLSLKVLGAVVVTEWLRHLRPLYSYIMAAIQLAVLGVLLS